MSLSKYLGRVTISDYLKLLKNSRKSRKVAKSCRLYSKTRKNVFFYRIIYIKRPLQCKTKFSTFLKSDILYEQKEVITFYM